MNEPTRLIVTHRESLYQSPIYLTPLEAGDVIDAPRVVQIIKDEYAKSGFSPKDVATGAVIITGESAKKRNAEAIVKELSSLAGNFVAASAGPNLESALAARGSGACEASRDGRKIYNIDVGGGTTNIALCEQGTIADCLWLPIGGRVCNAQNVEAAAGSVFARLVENPDAELWFSGGVAEVMHRLQRGEEVDDNEFGDCGVVLARALLAEAAMRRLKVFIPNHPIRATVIGAGAHSLQLSGSTVAVKETSLPLQDLPIITVSADLKLLHTALRSHDLDWANQPVGLMLTDLPKLGYSEIRELAGRLTATFKAARAKAPLVVLMQQDLAAALGQLLRAELPTTDLIVLDGIATAGGDYIDIGKSMANGQFVPVVIKELIFAPSAAVVEA